MVLNFVLNFLDSSFDFVFFQNFESVFGGHKGELDIFGSKLLLHHLKRRLEHELLRPCLLENSERVFSGFFQGDVLVIKLAEGCLGSFGAAADGFCVAANVCAGWIKSVKAKKDN